MNSTAAPQSHTMLPTPLLEEFRARAHTYDANNAFFEADFVALRERGYLAAPAPSAIGGAGLTLSQLVTAQRQLAAYAPATALGINMHLVWVQVAAVLHARGDDRLDWVLREAVQGEVFAFGVSEPGNDAVLLDAHATAVPDPDGGYQITGTKVFTTLSPVWTRLGLHARVVTAGERNHAETPHDLVFGFVTRSPLTADGSATLVRHPDQAHLGLSAGHISHPGSWNPLGMRATQSYTTELSGVYLTPEKVAARFPAYEASDPLVFAIFASFSLLTAAVYAGIADRALELATAAANRVTTSDTGEATTKLGDPDTAARLTSAVLAHRQSVNTLELLSRDVDDVRARDDWFVALAAARNQVTDEAQAAVTLAMRVAGASAYQAESELSRLMRDVLAGSYHPSSAAALARSVRGLLATPV